jgi:hypothetical protein
VSHPIKEYMTCCLISGSYTVPSFPVMRSSDAWRPLGRARPFGRKEIGLEVHGTVGTMVRILFILRLQKGWFLDETILMRGALDRYLRGMQEGLLPDVR